MATTPDYLSRLASPELVNANGISVGRQPKLKVIGATVTSDPINKQNVITVTPGVTGLTDVYPNSYPFQALIGQRVMASSGGEGDKVINSPDTTNAKEGDRFGVVLLAGANEAHVITVTSSSDPNGADLQDANNMLFDDHTTMSVAAGVYSCEWVYSPDFFRWVLVAESIIPSTGLKPVGSRVSLLAVDQQHLFTTASTSSVTVVNLGGWGLVASEIPATVAGFTRSISFEASLKVSDSNSCILELFDVNNNVVVTNASINTASTSTNVFEVLAAGGSVTLGNASGQIDAAGDYLLRARCPSGTTLDVQAVWLRILYT